MGAAIVHHDQFYILVCLFLDALDRSFQEPETVVGWDDDRNQGVRLQGQTQKQNKLRLQC